MRDHNRFKIGSTSYRWAHDRGEIILYTGHHPYVESRVGRLRIERDEWVLTQGAFKPPLRTGTANVVEAKKIVQVRLVMDQAATEGGSDDHKSL